MRFRRYVSWVAIVAGLLCLSLLQFGQAKQKKVSKAPRGDKQQSDEFYFGSSTTESSRVWFLSLDLTNRRGQLFRRPEALELTDVKVSESGAIIFRTERDLGEVIYQFEGEQDPNGITGRFHSIRAEPGADEERLSTYPVVLEKVTPVQNPQSGVYSNVRYIEESGDLIGEELILFWRGTEPRGIFSMYEGEYTEPLAISHVSLSGPNLKFRVLSEFGEESYAATISRNRLQLRRSDGKANSKFSRKVLLRKGEVRSVFEKPTGSTL